MNIYIVSTEGYSALISAQAHRDIQLVSALKWETVPRALPMQHHLTGPFMIDDSLPVIAIKDMVSQGVPVGRDMTNARNRMLAIERADAVFVWVTGPLSRSSYFDLSYAYASLKYIVVCAQGKNAIIDNPVLLDINSRPNFQYALDIRTAYEIAMEGVSPQDADKFVQMTAKYGGTCRGCGGPYGIGATIMWARKKGVYHKHCYDLNQSNENREAAMFSAELVKALQDRNAELENENTMLMARCSAIERQLRGEGL